MGDVLLFITAWFSKFWLYGTGVGPIALDALAQFFSTRYRTWAANNGALRRWFLTLVAIGGILWASFAAFQDQYAQTQKALGLRDDAAGSSNYWHGIADERSRSMSELQKKLDVAENKPPRIEFEPIPATRPSQPARDPDALYQLGSRVGSVTGAEIDQSHGVVNFATIAREPTLNAAKDLEYRDWVIRCPDIKPNDLPPGTFALHIIGGDVIGARCNLIRKRD